MKVGALRISAALLTNSVSRMPIGGAYQKPRIVVPFIPVPWVWQTVLSSLLSACAGSGRNDPHRGGLAAARSVHHLISQLPYAHPLAAHLIPQVLLSLPHVQEQFCLVVLKTAC